MRALGALSPIEDARAKLQEKIADFLAARARLSRLMSNPSLQIQGQAQGLYAVQVQLESQLQNEIMPKIQAVQSGTWSFSDLGTLGGFTMSMITQINDVNTLDAQAGGVTNTTPFIGLGTMALGVPLLIVAGLLGGVWLAKAKQ